MNSIAALALALKLATKPEFKELQQQTLKNTQALIKGFKENGARVAYGGSDSHMALIDCKTLPVPMAHPPSPVISPRVSLTWLASLPTATPFPATAPR